MHVLLLQLQPKPKILLLQLPVQLLMLVYQLNFVKQLCIMHLSPLMLLLRHQLKLLLLY